jgi:hypothetical protein
MEKKISDDQQRARFWKRHITECRKSGLNYAEYARRHDLKDGAFGYWRKKLPESPQQEPAFVELKVPAQKTNGIEIVLGDHMRISVGSDFDEATLKKLVGVLQSL